jgi:flagellum-specific peptidoglycan hydrolase FlgJ
MRRFNIIAITVFSLLLGTFSGIGNTSYIDNNSKAYGLDAYTFNIDNTEVASAATLTTKENADNMVSKKSSSPQTNTTNINFTKMSAKAIVNNIGDEFTKEQIRTGIPASVQMAQFILESGYGKSKLAKKGHNYFGMKTYLSGNNWKNSYWNGKSSYTIVTREVYKKKIVRKKAKFRKYSSFKQSLKDHSSYLAYSKNGKKLRYKGLVGCKNPKKAVRIIANGGYATGRAYEKALLSVIKKWNLTRFDVK